MGIFVFRLVLLHTKRFVKSFHFPTEHTNKKYGRITDLLISIFIMVGFLKNGSLYSFNEHDFCIYVCFHPLFYECIQCKYEISSKNYNNVRLSSDRFSQ